MGLYTVAIVATATAFLVGIGVGFFLAHLQMDPEISRLREVADSLRRRTQRLERATPYP